MPKSASKPKSSSSEKAAPSIGIPIDPTLPPPIQPIFLTVNVLSPNGGEVFTAGQTVSIQWQSTGASSQRVQYTLDGTNFTPIVTGLAGNVQAYDWQIPASIIPTGQTSVQVRIRVVAQDNLGSTAQDTSDNPFTINSALNVTVTSPNGGETFTAGQTVNIQWQANGAFSQRVQYSLDGVNYTAIVTGLAGSIRSYNWQIPASIVPAGQSSVQARIRVVVQDLPGNNAQDTSNGAFTINSATPPLSVTVNSPNGGEVFTAGQTVNIQWQSTGASSQRVQYSLDGVNYTAIVTGLAGNIQTYAWAIPTNLVPTGQSSVQALIRVVVQDGAGNMLQDNSNSTFTINAPAPTLSVTVTSPNGGETFTAGQTVNIQWQANGAFSQRVQYSLDGVNYAAIVTGLAGSIRSYNWQIPTSIIPAGQTNVQARIRVVVQDIPGNMAQDSSDGTFTINAPTPTLSVMVTSPNGGEVFTAGQTVNIQWQANGAFSQRVQYTLDGVNYTAIVTGLAGSIRSYNWPIPASIIPAGQTNVQARIRVVVQDIPGNMAQDSSDGTFTINAPAPTLSVMVTSPNGGETFTVGQTVNIQWQANGAFSQRVQYSLDGVNYTAIVTGLAGSIRSYNWPIPASIIPAGQTSAQARIRVVVQDSASGMAQDSSDGTFTINAPAPTLSVTVTSPNGGEVFTAGQTVNIQWQANGAFSQRVQYTLDGVNYTAIVIGLAGSIRSYNWPIPASIVPAGQTSVQARIRVVVQDIPGNMAQDSSDGAFTINAPAPTLSVMVTSPNGGETFTAGQTVNIQWQANGAFSQRVQYSLDGVNYAAIVTGLAGSIRSYNWPIPASIIPTGQPNVQVRIRVVVQDSAGNMAQDSSDNPFTIQPSPATIRVDAITPAHGPITGGTPVTIDGANFSNAPALPTVKIGGVEATNVQFINSTRLTATTGPQLMPGRYNLRVTNPDGQFAILEDAFQYDGPPVITKIMPNEGPAEQNPSSPQVITITGMNFQDGATVTFGKAVSPLVDLIGMDGTQLSVQVPASDKTGPVRVEVKNPDGQSGELREGFTYLGPRQSLQARISQVQPLTILENTPNQVTLRGRNLKKAYEEGVIAVRGPSRDVARISMTNVNVQPGGASQEDVVTFTLQVTVLKDGGLDVLERLPLQVVASVRKNAKRDLMTESSRGMLTVVSKTLPVPLGFTAQLKKGGTNLLVVAGRNLQNVRLEMVQPDQTVALDTQRAEENMVTGFFNVDGGAAGEYSLRLFDSQRGREVDVLPLTLVDAVEPVPGAMPDDPGLQLQPVPNQLLVADVAGGTAAVDLASNEYLAAGSPVLNSEFLLPGVSFQVASAAFEIPLFEEIRLLPFFDRGGDVLVDLPINVKVGRIFGIRALSLLLVVRVALRIEISVAVSTVVNPFVDTDFGQPFNEFSDVLPDPVADFPAAVFFQINVSIDVTLSVTFFLGLLQPGGGLIELASFGLGVTVGSGGFELDSGVSFQTTVRSIRPLGGVIDQIRHLPSLTSVTDDYGYFGFYFAEASGPVCLPWEFDFTLTRFTSGSDPEVSQTSFAPFICVGVNLNPNPLLDIRIEPPAINLDIGESIQAVAFDQDNNRLSSPSPVRFSLDDGSPAIAGVSDNGVVTGLAQGVTVIRALATTQSRGFALFPDPGLEFVVDSFLAVGLPPMAIVKRAAVGVLKQTVAVDYVGPTEFFLTRDEPIGTAGQPMPLDIKLKLPKGTTVTQDVPVKITVELQAVDDPLTTLFSGHGLTNFPDPAAGRANRMPEERFKRFFQPSFTLKQAISFTLKGGSDQPQTFGGVTLTPSRAETQQPANNPTSPLVPPHGLKGQIVLKVESDPAGPAIAPIKKVLKIQVVGSQTIGTSSTRVSETKEEYFRTLIDPQESLAQAPAGQPTFRKLLEDFSQGLAAFSSTNLQALKDYAKMQGMELWNKAVASVQAGTGDDRPLYWSRLQAITSLRKHSLLAGISSTEANNVLKMFELASRGMNSVMFGAGAKVLVTGFDPFEIADFPKRGNPSGAVALACSNINLTGGNVQSLIFPVRFADFDAEIVEDAVKALVPNLDLLVTFSQNPTPLFYEIERYASPTRNKAAFDNNYVKATSPKNYFPLTKPNRVLESTLPYSAVVSQPDMPAPGSTSSAERLLLEQSFAVGKSKSRPDSQSPNADAFVPVPLDADDKKFPGMKDTLTEGSAGSFLSNEIFYRTARVRYEKKETLPSGHVHLPVLPDTFNSNKRQAQIGVVKALLSQLLDGQDVVLLPLTYSTSLKLKVGSQPQMTKCSVQLPSSYPANSVTVKVSMPQLVPGSITDAFKITPAAGSVTLTKSKAVEILTAEFNPNAVKYFAAAVFLTDDATGKRLFRVNVVGQGTK